MNLSLSRLLQLAAGVSLTASCVAAAPPSSGGTASGGYEAASDVEQAVIERARRALSERGERAEALEVASVTEAEWPDSSLGCGRPGSSYLQVVTPGHVVVFAGAGGRREVHVAARHAVVCDTRLEGMPRRPRAALPARNLDAMIAAARKDLAAQLRTEPQALRVLRLTGIELPEGALGCEIRSADSPAPGRRGYLIVLDHGGRAYTYHTDLEAVAACPPITVD